MPTHFFLYTDRDRLDLGDEGGWVEWTGGWYAGTGLVDLCSLKLRLLDKLIDGLSLTLGDDGTHIHALRGGGGEGGCEIDSV